MRLGIDVSDNQGIIDWEKVKAAGCEFAVLRTVRRSGKTDYQFVANMAGCRQQDIPVDAYKYTYALTIAQAREEAQQVVNLLLMHGFKGSVYWDVEDKSLRQLSRDKLTECILAAKEVIEAAGLKFALYTGLHVYREKWFDFSRLAGVPVWIARYPYKQIFQFGELPDQADKPVINRPLTGWQFTSMGRVPGISGNVDLDIIWEEELMTVKEIRQMIVATAESFIGYKEADGTHKSIVDIYNTYLPHPRGYKLKYNDAWCAPFVSVVAIIAGCIDIMPVECSCGQMVKLYQQLGRWQESDSYVPEPGDVIFYDWQDTGKGDNTGWPDHVGIVVSVINNKIKVIEGNKDDAVNYRTLEVNARYIRGYGLPDYGAKETKSEIKGTYGLPAVSKCFAACGIPATKEERTKIAEANGIKGYTGTVEQNMQLMHLWTGGKLITI